MRAEISPNLIENVPPKPQHDFAFGHLGQHQPRNLGQQRARLALDAHFAQSGAGIVIGHRSGETAGHMLELQFVDEEVA